MWVHFGTCTPQLTACVPPIVSIKSCSRTKIRVNAKTKSEVLGWRPFLFYFWSSLLSLWAGAYLGGGPLGHGPLFGSPGLQNCLEKWAKLRHGPPLWVGHQTFRLLAGNLSDFERKTGRNLSEDLFFFFALHLILGEKWDEIWVWLFQILIYAPLKFSEVSAPPPFFKNPVYATVCGQKPRSAP